MPEISRFYGIVIKMNTNEHPPPHFHAEYGEHEALVSIVTGEVIRGNLPNRALRMVLEWRGLHQVELQDNWGRMLTRQSLFKIEPL